MDIDVFVSGGRWEGRLCVDSRGALQGLMRHAEGYLHQIMFEDF